MNQLFMKRVMMTSISPTLVFFWLLIRFAYADLTGLENELNKAYDLFKNGDTTKLTKGNEMMKNIATHSVMKKNKNGKFDTSSVSNHVELLVSYEYSKDSVGKLLDEGIKNLLEKSSKKPGAADHKWMTLALDNIGGVHCRDFIGWYSGTRPAKCPTTWNKNESFNEIKREDLYKKKSPNQKFYFNKIYTKTVTHVTKTGRTPMLYIVIDIAPKLCTDSKESPTSLKTKRDAFRNKVKKINFSQDKDEIVKALANIHKDFMKFCLEKGIAEYVKDIRALAEKFVEDTGGDVEEKVRQFEAQKNAGFTATDHCKGKIYATKSEGKFAEHAMAHEVMHLLSAEDGKTPFFHQWHNSVNEGATDYLTRLVHPVKANVEDRFYMQQAQMMQALSEKSADAFKAMVKIYFSIEKNADKFKEHFQSSKEHIINCFGGGDAKRFEKVTSERDVPMRLYNRRKKKGEWVYTGVNKVDNLGLKFPGLGWD